MVVNPTPALSRPARPTPHTGFRHPRGTPQFVLPYLGRWVLPQVICGVAEKGPNARLQVERVGGEHPFRVDVLPRLRPGVVAGGGQALWQMALCLFRTSNHPQTRQRVAQHLPVLEWHKAKKHAIIYASAEEMPLGWAASKARTRSPGQALHCFTMNEQAFPQFLPVLLASVCQRVFAGTRRRDSISVRV